MKKIILIIALFLLSSCGREVDHYGEVIEKVHRLPSYKSTEQFCIVREVYYKDGTKDYETFTVSKEEYYKTKIITK